MNWQLSVHSAQLAARAWPACSTPSCRASADRCLPHSENLRRFFDDMGLKARTEPVINSASTWTGWRRGMARLSARAWDWATTPWFCTPACSDQFQRIDLLRRR